MRRFAKIYYFWLFALAFLMMLLCSGEKVHRGIALPIEPLPLLPVVLAVGALPLLPKIPSGRFDMAALMLLMRVPLLLVPLVYTTDMEGYLGNFFSVLITVYAYAAGSNTYRDDLDKYVYRFLLVVGLIIVAQMFVVIQGSLGAIGLRAAFKTRIDIPAGRSNSIATYLLMVFFFVLAYDTKVIRKAIVLSVLLSGLFLTMSRGGLLALVAIMMLRAAFPLRGRSMTSRRVMGAVVVVVFGVGAIVLLPRLLPGVLSYVQETVDRIRSAATLDLNAVSNSRLDVYIMSIHRFLKHPMLGNGLGFPGTLASKMENIRPHNIILEALTQGGIIHLIVFLWALGAALGPLARHRQDRFCEAVLWFTIPVLVHGMVEPALFSPGKDLFFWSVVGFGVARARRIEYAAAPVGEA